MKKVILMLLVFSSYNCYAQRVTYQDLNYLLYRNLPESVDYLTKKGFEFDGVRTASTDTNATDLNFSKYATNSKNYILISKSAIKQNYYSASFTTYLKSDYLLFLSSLKSRGFVLSESKVYNGSLVSTYKKGHNTFTIWTNKNPIINAPDYTFTISDDSLADVAFNSEKE